MTEHAKIPVPADEESTLIERAVRAFDLNSFAPPPVPTDLAPPIIKPGVRNRRRADALAPAVVAEPAVLPVLAADTAPVDTASGIQPNLPAPAVVPVKFKGKHNPVDRQHLRDQGMIVPEGSVTGLLEEFRIIKRQLLLQAAELRQHGGGAAAQRVLVCSPHPGEGKTYCSVNLALSIAAEKESEVLLVDADFAKPSVLTTLGLPGGPGLMDALVDPSLDVADCVLGTDIPGLWVLPAGNATNSDSEFLSSSRTATVLDRLTEGAPNRFVIFDSPPALAASPAAELAKYVGQAMVVARADRTGQGALEDAIKLLSGCPNVQLLLNAVHFSPSGRRFGSYYGYGG
jgi:Mrp family chromosome partitioning ATPase